MSHNKPVPVLSAMYPKRPGEALPNGAIILAEEIIRCYEFRRDSIVLAVVPGKSYQPFVSWHRIVTSDSPLATGGYHVVDTTMYGQYSTNLDHAWIRFGERVEEQLDKLDQEDANAEGKERLRLESRS